MDNRTKAAKLWPLVLTLVVVAVDQITKYAIVKTIPPFTIGSSFFGGILRIWRLSLVIERCSASQRDRKSVV